MIRQYIYTEGGVLYRNMTFLKTNRRMRRRIRKFADIQRTNRQSSRQTDSSNTEATLILCGSSGERANNRGDTTITEEDEEMN